MSALHTGVFSASWPLYPGRSSPWNTLYGKLCGMRVGMNVTNRKRNTVRVRNRKLVIQSTA